ncbi:hypothetical protein B0H15DRAFT_803711 [Mycena belliarum]|uniref:Uncharacterized protein n=1 Tax=Mycena belliarum TaxID=1033014 RepID=A0AAD6TZ75_9AGAR|nr:hypothetical protein B0H15DRAFT_803711 [Mycena belliae]
MSNPPKIPKRQPAPFTPMQTRQASGSSDALATRGRGGSAGGRGSVRSVTNPTSSSLAGQISAPLAPSAPFGSNEPRLPSLPIRPDPLRRAGSLAAEGGSRPSESAELDSANSLGKGALPPHAQRSAEFISAIRSVMGTRAEGDLEQGRPSSHSSSAAPVAATANVEIVEIMEIPADVTSLSPLTASARSSTQRSTSSRASSGGSRASRRTGSEHASSVKSGYARQESPAQSGSERSGRSPSSAGSRGSRRDPPAWGPALDNESITAALSQQRRSPSPPAEYERFFTGIGRSIDLFHEPLFVSVERLHLAYDPNSSSQEDPLMPFGASGGELPGTDPASTLMLRDAVIRYQHRERHYSWNFLSELIKEVAGFDASAGIVMPTVVPDTNAHAWSLNLHWLSRTAHAVFAVQQILDALHQFLGHSLTSARFIVDPRFALVYTLEAGPNQWEVRFALSSLQLRLVRADSHIAQQLRGIRQTLTGHLPDDDDEPVSSVDSSITAVREEYGTGSAQQELYRLINRPDYGRRVALINADEHRRMLEALAEPQRERYYRERHDPQAWPTMKEKEASGAASAASAAASAPSGPAPSGRDFFPAGNRSYQGHSFRPHSLLFAEIWGAIDDAHGGLRMRLPRAAATELRLGGGKVDTGAAEVVKAEADTEEVADMAVEADTEEAVDKAAGEADTEAADTVVAEAEAEEETDRVEED